jgi:cell division septal protein FtsQ
MRDYKNVSVPKAYRTAPNRTTAKRKNVVLRTAGPRKKTGGSAALVRFAVVLLLAGGCFLAWQAYLAIVQARSFTVTGVDVQGVKRLGESELREIVGAFTGRNIFRVDLDAAARRARENPWVKTVSIHRSLPNRISMDFTERSAYAVLDNGTARYLMDREGFILERLEKEKASAWPLPVIVARDCRARPGEQADFEAFPDAMLLLEELASRREWKPADLVITASSPETLGVFYAGQEFKLGRGRTADKLRRLSEVLADAKARGIELASADLRPERQAAVMRKDRGRETGAGKKAGR